VQAQSSIERLFQKIAPLKYDLSSTPKKGRDRPIFPHDLYQGSSINENSPLAELNVQKGELCVKGILAQYLRFVWAFLARVQEIFWVYLRRASQEFIPN
jgi:hypothetical protein